MKQSRWMKFKKALALMLTVATTMIATTATILADEVKAPQISKWSIGVLNEGEKYGIFPMAWYYEDFQKPITAEKLKVLLAGVNEKLENLGLKANGTFTPEEVGQGITRGEVITLLYNELGKYEMPGGTKLSDSKAAAYFQKRGILKGSSKGLELDKPCTAEQAAVLASKLIEDTYNIAQTGGQGFIWKATKGDNTLYLLGSIHIGDSAMYPLRQEVKDAFKEADALIVEANMFNNQEGLNEFVQQAQYGDGTTLKDHISEDNYIKALKVFEKLGLPTEQYVKFKPWSIANDLTVISGSNSNSLEGGAQAATLGVDLYFTTTALVTGKPIIELEGLKYQAELFNGLSEKLQEENLVAALDSILTPPPAGEQTGGDLISLWQKQWYEGNLADFSNSYGEVMKDLESEYNKTMLGKRDKDMTDKLASLLDKEGKATYFVVVGAGHLVVKDMVIDQLKSKGYKVEPFKY